MYCVSKIVTQREVLIETEQGKISRTLKMSFADGMIGVMPGIFDTLESAEKYSGGEGDISKLTRVE